MITRPDDPYRGYKRTFQVALIVSLLIHPLIIALIAARFDLRHPNLDQLARKQQKTETVTLSSSTKVAPKTVAQAQPRPHHTRPRTQPQPKAVAVVDRPIRPQEVANDKPKVLEKPRVVPTYVPPIPQAKELAKIAREGTPVPLPAPTTQRTPKPIKPPKQTPPPEERQERSVAYNERSTTTAATQSKAERLAQQVAQINSELAKDVRAQQGYSTALSNVSKAVTDVGAPKHYNIDFHSLNGTNRYAQGVCDPIKEWDMNGYDYYYMACNVVEPDGSMTRKPLPWPLRFHPSDDPYGDDYQGGHTSGKYPIPMPLPGWKPDPAHPIDPDFIPYLRQGGYAI